MLRAGLCHRQQHGPKGGVQEDPLVWERPTLPRELFRRLHERKHHIIRVRSNGGREKLRMGRIRVKVLHKQRLDHVLGRDGRRLLRQRAPEPTGEGVRLQRRLPGGAGVGV